MFALRMQRCFCMLEEGLFYLCVCSAHAEMFPSGRRTKFKPRRLLCACRDVSETSYYVAGYIQFALRMQRCFYTSIFLSTLLFVCSAHAEMFLFRPSTATLAIGLLCACRDVSDGSKLWHKHK